ncbi:MAG: FAD-dependent oxidoreductase [Cyclobacteriaceae bacterium]|nr:FAD-dependent oxidoreductase [Cyclobacteriaceae bacterium]
MEHSGKHFIAIIGGSVAGSEAAFMLAERGFRVVVFDQKNLPYGKIEDGLPKWHVGLRNKEERLIDERLSHPNIRFVPGFRLGRDATLDELANQWGFSAVIIAIGAWRDRKLPMDGIDKFRNNGLIYQNDLLYWYNHNHEPDYRGPKYDLKDNTCVVGGGLASIDVVKMIMIDLVQKALKEKKGVEVDLFTFEKKGVTQILEDNETNLEELGVKGCTLFYRRNTEDMPLYPRKGDSPEDVLKAKQVTEKLLKNYQSKYLFQFEPLCVPKGFTEENGKLTGVTFQRVRSENGKLVETDESCFFETELLISSIGSLPEELPSVPYDGSYLDTYGEFGYQIKGYDNVFAIGNVVTGKGNIIDSKKHGREITGKILDEHFADITLSDPMEEKYSEYFRKIEGEVGDRLESIISELEGSEAHSDEEILFILKITKQLQEKVDYDGDYQKWVDNQRPVRLEEL